MIVHTKDGDQYAIDMKRRVVNDLPFHHVNCVYAGSPGAVFKDEHGTVLFETGEIERIDGDVPSECVSGDSGNVIVRTQNSAYEIDQEQKLIRRLAGANKTVVNALDGEWIAYSRIDDCWVGRYATVHYADNPEDFFVTSRIREIVGDFVHAPTT